MKDINEVKEIINAKITELEAEKDRKEKELRDSEYLYTLHLEELGDILVLDGQVEVLSEIFNSLK